MEDHPVNPFSIETLWLQYCDLCGVKDEELEPHFRGEMKRAFVAAIGMFINLLKSPEMSEQGAENIADILHDMHIQTANYFLLDNNQLN